MAAPAGELAPREESARVEEILQGGPCWLRCGNDLVVGSLEALQGRFDLQLHQLAGWVQGGCVDSMRLRPQFRCGGGGEPVQAVAATG